MKIEIKAIIYLFLATMLWGLTFPVIKNAVSVVAPATFVTLRFALAALVLLPFIIGSFKKSSFKTIGAGIILGVLNSSVYLTQTIGVQTIDAAQAAFIVGTTVIFVPFMAPWFKLGKPRKIDVTAAVIFLLGLFIFTGFAMQFKIGSVWCFFSALGVALSIVFLQFTTKKALISLPLLAFYQILFTVPIPAIITIHAGYHNIFTFHAIIGILFCAIFATSIALLWQTKYQHFINPTKATLIYALEPVFAMVFASMINQEKITWLMTIGGTIMLIGSLLHVFTARQK